jgi:hypothetical protein
LSAIDRLARLTSRTNSVDYALGRSGKQQIRAQGEK